MREPYATTRHPGWRPAIVLAMLLAVPSAAASAPIEGVVESAWAEFQGSAHAQGQAFFLGIPLDTQGPRFSGWSVNAATAKVQLHGERWTEVGGVINDGRRDPITYGPYEHQELRADSTRVGDFFSLSVTPFIAEGAFRVLSDAEHAQVRPSSHVSFPAEGEPLAAQRAHTVDIASVRLEPMESAEPIVIEGDIILEVFDNDFSVRDAEGEPTTYQSGIFRTNKVGQEVIDSGVTAEVEERYARIELTSAVLTLLPASQSYAVYFHELDVLLDGKARLMGTQGTLTSAGRTWQLADDSLEIHAERARFTLAPADGSQSIRGQLGGEADVVWIEGAPQTLADGGRVDGLPWGQVPLWIGGVAVAGAGVAIVLVLRRRQAARDPDFLAYRAEEELVRGNYDGAIEQTRRALSNHPTHLNATVTQAIALLKVGRPSEAVAFLQEQLPRVQNDEGILRLLQCLGLFEIGNEKEGVEALELALEGNPGLGQQLVSTDLWDRIKQHPRLLHLMPNVDPGASYV